MLLSRSDLTSHIQAVEAPHQLDDDVLAYALRCSTEEDAVLKELRTRTWQTVLSPQMLSDPLQGKLLENWSRMLAPKRILELGTYTGYSTICLAKGLAPDGELVTIEPNDELNGLQDEFWERAGMRHLVKRYNDEASNILPQLSGTFDLVWIDADKPRTPEYVRQCLSLIRTGGWILVDNVLWWGKVMDAPSAQDETSRILNKMNAELAQMKNLRTALIPIRDGILMIEKVTEPTD